MKKPLNAGRLGLDPIRRDLDQSAAFVRGKNDEIMIRYNKLLLLYVSQTSVSKKIMFLVFSVQ